MPIAYVFFLPAEEKKWKKETNQEWKKNSRRFSPKPVFQNECHAKE